MKLKHLKRDQTLLMTSLLLLFMLGAGLCSGIVGFTLGHAALKGVTQPDIRPNNKSINQQNLKTRGLEVLAEKQLVATSREIMGLPKDEADDRPDQFSIADKPAVVFPFESKDQGILLKVKSAKPEGKFLRLDLALANQGSQAAKFSSDVLTVNDDSGKSISANFSGLPQTLAANGKEVNVKVLIPTDALGKSKTVTLLLTDADRKLQIEATHIPVSAPAASPVSKPKPKSSVKLDIPDGKLGKEAESEKPEKATNSKPKAAPKPKLDNTNNDGAEL